MKFKEQLIPISGNRNRNSKVRLSKSSMDLILNFASFNSRISCTSSFTKQLRAITVFTFASMLINAAVTQFSFGQSEYQNVPNNL